jgi:hypothetical protein
LLHNPIAIRKLLAEMKRLLHFMMNWPDLLSGIPVSKHPSFSIHPAFSCKKIGHRIIPVMLATQSNQEHKVFSAATLPLRACRRIASLRATKQLFPDKRGL